jgi:S-adenosylmethionine hydrolase
MKIITPTPLTLAFLSDYDTSDPYVGILHAVALSRLTPNARLRTQRLDLTHGIPAFDRRAGAWALLQSLPYLPPHTVTVAIVDPEVGRQSQGVAILFRPTFQQVFLAPDNGLLAPLLPLMPDALSRSFTHDEVSPYTWFYPSEAEAASAGQTFHGRDVYTPLACSILNAWSSEGHHDEEETFPLFKALSQEHSSPLQGPSPFPAAAERHGGKIEAHVLKADGFGNIITTVPSHWFGEAISALQIITPEQDFILPLFKTYVEGQYATHGMAVRGSHGYIELAYYGGAFPMKLPPDTTLSLYPLPTTVA